MSGAMLSIFWVIGLFAIGILPRLLTGAMYTTTSDSEDKHVYRLVVGWCTFFALIWFAGGGLIIFNVLLEQIK